MSINFELSANSILSRDYYRGIAEEQMRPISRKYDEEEHALPTEWVGPSPLLSLPGNVIHSSTRSQQALPAENCRCRPGPEVSISTLTATSFW